MTADETISGSVSVESSSTAIIKVCKQLLAEIEANNYSSEEIFSVHLALEEAFINAIKHGNKLDSSKTVQIDYVISPEKVEITMTDEGQGFNPRAVPDPRVGENIYKTEGRGLLLINSYMDEVNFNETGNRVHMIKYKTKAGGVPSE
ncbi:MAG: ATP-binding protein [Planctomycetota bacterium]|jgi:serine/threonine-protein kinase RsbW